MQPPNKFVQGRKNPILLIKTTCVRSSFMVMEGDDPPARFTSCIVVASNVDNVEDDDITSDIKISGNFENADNFLLCFFHN